MNNIILKVSQCLPGWLKLARKFKDFQAPTVIFKDFQGLEFFFKFQGLSKCVRTLFLSDKRGGVGDLLIEGGNYFKYFHQRGGIIRGRQLIKGQLLFKEME